MEIAILTTRYMKVFARRRKKPKFPRSDQIRTN